MIEDFWKYSEKEKIDKRYLLREFALDIAKKYSLGLSETEKLIKWETLSSLDALKDELKNNKHYIDLLKGKRLEELFFTLKWAFEVTENISRLKIKVLRDELRGRNIDIENFEKRLENYLPIKLVNKARKPNLLHEHLLGISLGVANSLMITTEVLYGIWIGFLKAPYDIYLLVTGKGKMKNWNKV